MNIDLIATSLMVYGAGALIFCGFSLFGGDDEDDGPLVVAVTSILLGVFWPLIVAWIGIKSVLRSSR